MYPHTIHLNTLKKAVAVGAFKYLLKPVKRKDIIACVNELIGLRELERKKKINQDASIRAKLSTIKPLVENELIQSVIYHDAKKMELLQNADLLDFDIQSGYCIAISGLPNGDDSKAKRIKEKIRSKISSHYTALIGESYNGTLIAIVAANSHQSESDTMNETKDFANKLINDLQKSALCNIHIGIGKPYPCLDLIHQSFKEAKRSLDQSVGLSPVRNYPIDQERELCHKIRLGLRNDAQNAFEEFMQSLYAISEDNELNDKVQEAWTVLQRLFSSTIDKKNSSNLPGISDETLRSASFIELKKQVWGNIEACIILINQKRHSSTDHVVEKAKTYIEGNFGKSLSLESVAEEIAVSPYYLSKLFKQHSGENFIDFLTNVRIENAKILIRSTNHSVKEIARQVGYSNSNYFSRVFKKVTSMKPLEFRDK